MERWGFGWRRQGRRAPGADGAWADGAEQRVVSTRWDTQDGARPAKEIPRGSKQRIQAVDRCESLDQGGRGSGRAPPRSPRPARPPAPGAGSIPQLRFRPSKRCPGGGRGTGRSGQCSTRWRVFRSGGTQSSLDQVFVSGAGGAKQFPLAFKGSKGLRSSKVASPGDTRGSWSVACRGDRGKLSAPCWWALRRLPRSVPQPAEQRRPGENPTAARQVSGRSARCRRPSGGRGASPHRRRRRRSPEAP